MGRKDLDNEEKRLKIRLLKAQVKAQEIMNKTNKWKFFGYVGSGAGLTLKFFGVDFSKENSYSEVRSEIREKVTGDPDYPVWKYALSHWWAWFLVLIVIGHFSDRRKKRKEVDNGLLRNK